MKYFPANMEYLRKSNNLKQAEIQDRLGIERSTWSNYERGKSFPSLELFYKIVNYFGVKADDALNVDLSNVHPNEKTETSKFGQNVHLNVHASVHPSVEKGAKSPYLAENKSHTGDVENHIVNDDGLPIRVGVMPAVVTIDTTGEENAVFVPVRARAGYLAGYGDTEFIGTLPAVKLLGARNRTYRIFEVDGNSMFNTLNDKDKVNAYWVRLSEVRDERIYVIVTRSEGIIIKRVINRYNTEGVLICKSDNNHKGEYPPIVLPVSDIVEIWYVEEATTRNLAPPGAIYDRVSQLEATVAIVMEKMKAQNSS